MGGEVVDTGALAQLVWVSLVAGLVLVGAMSVAIVGYARAAQERRQRHASAAAAYMALGVAGTGVIAAAVAVGIAIMLDKG